MHFDWFNLCITHKFYQNNRRALSYLYLHSLLLKSFQRPQIMFIAHTNILAKKNDVFISIME